MDAVANFAVGTVATAPSPATSGTSVTLGSGQGARFPAAPFNVVLVPTNTTPDNYFTTAEIARVTAISTDTLTITRAQEGTTARSVAVGWYVMLAPTAKTITDLAKPDPGVLINAVGFPVNQRSGSSYSATGWTVDRWYFTLGSGATDVITPTVPSPGHVPGFIENYLAWNRTVAGTTDCSLDQPIESVSSYAGQTVTVSILCDTVSGSIDFVPSLLQHFGTGGTPSSDVTTTGSTLTATTSLQTLTATISVPSIAGKTLGTNGDDYLDLIVTRPHNATNGATGQLNIHAIKIESGLATPFPSPLLTDVLSKCQRFHFRRYANPTTGYTNFGFGAMATNTIADFYIQFPVTMRRIPTFSSGGTLFISDYNLSAGSGLTPILDPNYKTVDAAVLQITSGISGTQYRLMFLGASAAGSYIAFDAELK